MMRFVSMDLLMPVAQMLFWGTFIRRGMAARAGKPVAARAGTGPVARHSSSARHPALGGWVATAGFIVLGFGFSAGSPGSQIGQVAGLALSVLAVALSIWSLSVFRSWRLAAEIEQGHELATQGPFRFIRHPIYLALALNAAGIFLWRPSVVSGLGVVIVYVSGEIRSRAEEQVLVDAFGETYIEYMSRTKRFLPRVY